MKKIIVLIMAFFVISAVFAEDHEEVACRIYTPDGESYIVVDKLLFDEDYIQSEKYGIIVNGTWIAVIPDEKYIDKKSDPVKYVITMGEQQFACSELLGYSHGSICFCYKGMFLIAHGNFLAKEIVQ